VTKGCLAWVKVFVRDKILNWQLTAASITRLQFSEWYGTSKQKFKLFIFLLTNNCYKVALCTPLHAWHGHVAPRHINWSGDAMVIVASNTCRIWLPDLLPNSVLFGWPEYPKNKENPGAAQMVPVGMRRIKWVVGGSWSLSVWPSAPCLTQITRAKCHHANVVLNTCRAE
jgi:hypothetical protein